MSSAKDMIAEAKRRNKIDLPHKRCQEAPLREKCNRCLAHDLAAELETLRGKRIEYCCGQVMSLTCLKCDPLKAEDDYVHEHAKNNALRARVKELEKGSVCCACCEPLVQPEAKP